MAYGNYGSEQTSIDVNTPDKEVDASNALVKGGNNYNVWDDDWVSDKVEATKLRNFGTMEFGTTDESKKLFIYILTSGLLSRW